MFIEVNLFILVSLVIFGMIMGVMIGLCAMCWSSKIRIFVNKFFYGEYEEKVVLHCGKEGE
jgi:ABC-type lipoprotein release transport system permease subunit